MKTLTPGSLLSLLRCDLLHLAASASMLKSFRRSTAFFFFFFFFKFQDKVGMGALLTLPSPDQVRPPS